MEPTRVACRVPTRAPTGRTHAYVLGDRESLLIDPAARTERLDALTDVGHVAVTHHHPDHVGAVADYAADHDATVWCRVGREAAFEAAAGVTPHRTFAEGTVIPAGDGVTILDTPGHAPEHVAFGFDRGDDEAYLVGDLAVAEGSVVVGHPEGDLRAYLASLRRLWARDPDRLYPAHGPVIEDPRGTCARLLAHRTDRETDVLRAIENGAGTVPEITDAAYRKDLSGVRDLAEATVRAHVEKLRVEHQVDWDGTRARRR
jgi:glyoxylase-like metal-dependent hydrolase (beta-lactamase superfamily II)